MKWLVVIFALFISTDVYAARKVKKVRCPAYIGDLDAGKVRKAKNRYKCFSTLKSAISDGFYVESDENSQPAVANFSGEFDTSTASFTISNTPAKIFYTHGGTGHFSITLYSFPSNRYEDLIINEIGPLSNSTFLYKSGTYYFEVKSSGPWTIMISQ